MRSPPHSLIVDDNAANLDIQQARLTSQGCKVLTAEDGEQGRASARENTPDLILIDIMMLKIDDLREAGPPGA